MDNRDLWLGTAVVELAEADGGERAIAERLVIKLTELLVPAEVGLLISDGAGQLRVAVASCQRASELAAFEIAHDDGPLTECVSVGQPVLGEALATAAARWPDFALAATAAGVGIASAFPLIFHEHMLGAVSVLSAESSPSAAAPAAASLRRAGLLIRAGAVAIFRHRELTEKAQVAGQLQHALDSRVLIEQAKGAAAARLGITPEAAFLLMRAYARQASRSLAEVARQTITGELPISDLFGLHPAGRRPQGRQS